MSADFVMPKTEAISSGAGPDYPRRYRMYVRHGQIQKEIEMSINNVARWRLARHLSRPDLFAR